MLTAKDIRGVKFSKSVGGYKQEEVDVLLDRVEVDYDQYERTLRELQARIDTLSNEIDGYKNSQNSLQSVLLSAQKLADQIVDEARAKSEEILRTAQQSVDSIELREKELSAEFEANAARRREALTQEVETSVRAAEEKKIGMEAAAADAVARQQLLFDKMKLEVAAFKGDVMRRYREHLELLQKLPDEVPMDPKQVAAALAAVIDEAPDVAAFVKQPEPAAEPAPAAEESGFVIEDIALPEEEEE